jgi:hypothetical protein
MFYFGERRRRAGPLAKRLLRARGSGGYGTGGRGPGERALADAASAGAALAGENAMEDNGNRQVKAMSRPHANIVLFLVVLLASAAEAANPAMGHISGPGVEIAAVFLDAAALKQATGSDFASAYTVIEVTVTPKDGKGLELQPDDFLLRIGSSADSSGPLAASQVYGAGNVLSLQGTKQTIGITPTDQGYSGLTVVRGSGNASGEEIAALQKKMLPAGKITAPVTGLLFFPIAKKKAKDLDLVYSAADGKLHISFR